MRFANLIWGGAANGQLHSPAFTPAIAKTSSHMISMPDLEVSFRLRVFFVCQKPESKKHAECSRQTETTQLILGLIRPPTADSKPLTPARSALRPAGAGAKHLNHSLRLTPVKRCCSCVSLLKEKFCCSHRSSAFKTPVQKRPRTG